MEAVRAFWARHEAGTILEEAESRLLEVIAALDAEGDEGGAISEAREKIVATYGGIVGLRCIVGFGNIDAAITNIEASEILCDGTSGAVARPRHGGAFLHHAAPFSRG